MSIIQPITKWEGYIKKTAKSRRQMRPLHYQSKMIWNTLKKKNPRALSFGSGDGKEEIDLMSRGWETTCIDIEPYSNLHMKNKIKKHKYKGVFIYQNVSFEDAKLTGKYDYIMAFNSLPFGSKNKLITILNNISKHSKSNTILAINMFGHKHSFVKNKVCYSMTEEKIKKLLEPNFKIIHMERLQYDRPFKNDHWDEIEIIALFK